MPKGIPKNGINRGWFICGNKGYWLGKKRDKKTVDMLRALRIGKKTIHSEITKEKIREGVKKQHTEGRGMGIEAKKRLSERGKKLIGNKNPFFGRKHTKEDKIKMSDG